MERKMKKLVVVINMFMLLTLDIYALDDLHFKLFGNEYATGIKSHFGFSKTQLLETVYLDSSTNKQTSKIDWDIGFQMLAGAGLSVGPVNPFKKTSISLEGMFNWYFPVNGGKMNDTDWDDDGMIYAYGESIVSTIAGMEAEGRLTFNFPINDKNLIEALVGIWYGRYAVEAHDGWIGLYDDEKVPIYGTAIGYIQEWIIFAPGIGFRRELRNSHIGIRVAISPFVWGYHIDNHYFRKLDDGDSYQRYISFIDRTKGGLYYRIQGDWLWNMTKYVQIGVAVSYQSINKSRGNTIINTTGFIDHSFTERGTAGAEIKNISCSISIKTFL
jgi:outer membrane protease